MRTNFKKWLTCFFAVVLLAALLMPVCGAAELNTGNYVDWRVSLDKETLTDGKNTYTRYYPTKNFDVVLDGAFCYRYDARIEGDGLYSIGGVYSYQDGGDIVWINRKADYIYVTPRGRELLDAFFDERINDYALIQSSQNSSGRYIARIDKEFVSRLDNGYAADEVKLTKEVTELKFKECYTVTGFDESGSFSVAQGAVYFTDGGYYYLNYRALGNQYFDSEGNFSYRSGSVELSRLDASEVNDVKLAVDNMKPFPNSMVEYEMREMSSGGIVYANTTSAMIAFWVMFSLIGYVAPIVLGTVSFFIARSEKRGRPKYWYINTAIAGAWMLAALILMIVLLV